MKKSRMRKYVYHHRFMLFFFVYVVLYNIVIVNRFVSWEVDDYAIYSFYSVDFSCGFATKLLPGAIFRALCGSQATRSAATLFMTVVMLLFFVGLAILLQRFMCRMPAEHRTAALFLLLFFLSGAYTFAIFTKTIGLLDTFWLCFTLVFFFLIENKWLRCLIPILFAATIFVHNAAMISYIVLMSIVLLYRTSISEKRAERRDFLIVLIMSDVVAVGLFLFFSLKETDLICSIDEFHDKLLSHGSDCFYYYDYAFFDIYNGEPYVPDWVYSTESVLTRALYVVYYRIRLNIRVLLSRESIHIASLCCGLLVLVPILCFVIRFHWGSFRKKGNGLRRFCSLLMVVQFPFTFFSAMLFSEDITRWLSHSLLIAFTCLLVVLFYDPEQRERFMRQWVPIKDSSAVKLFFLGYALINFFTIY